MPRDKSHLLFDVADSQLLPLYADADEVKNLLLKLNEKFLIVGTDEAGRGALAGPVVAAAAFLNPEQESELLKLGLKDSKKMTPKGRERIFNAMCELGVAFAYQSEGVAVIEENNILNASLTAMEKCVNKLNNKIEKIKNKPVCVVVDGPSRIKNNDFKFLQWPLVSADLLIPAVSAASIVAKVTRDKIMLMLDEIYPDYKFAKNKGYPTKEHREILTRSGLSPVHRRSFCRKISV